MTYAKIIADSFSDEGHRLTTMEVRFHRFVLAEFNTHRAFSRNSASSRAIPVAKQLERVRNDMAEPLEWPQEQRGMQGGDEVLDAQQARTWWRSAGLAAADTAEALANLGVHKSVTNRLLEPFMWHTVVVTATEWDGFFEQRCSPLAQPEIRAVAEMMREAYDGSTPTHMPLRGWHLPYITDEDMRDLTMETAISPSMYRDAIGLAKKVSAARCARVSYLTHDGKRDVKEDLALFDRLVAADPPHWSPLEHVATPWVENASGSMLPHFYMDDRLMDKRIYRAPRPRVGNLLGWRSLRSEFEAVAA